MHKLLTHLRLIFWEKSFYFIPIVFSIGYHTSGFCVAPNEFSIAISTDLDLEITQYPSSGKYLFIWPYLPNMGENKNQYTLLAKTLTDNGIEVWYCDIVTALFLTYGSNTLRNMSGKYVANLLKKAAKKYKESSIGEEAGEIFQHAIAGPLVQSWNPA